jgi:hypothetical protein
MLKDLAAWGCKPEDLASERIKMKASWSRKRSALIMFFFFSPENGTWELGFGNQRATKVKRHVDDLNKTLYTIIFFYIFF